MINRRLFLASSTIALVGGVPRTLSANHPGGCREGSTIRLRDGRRLSYSTYGDPAGWPVLYFHGIPTSRIEARFFASAALRAGCRLIAIDRPGFGLSDFQHGRRIVDWLQDFQEFIRSDQLPADLNINEFSVASFSSGAAYVLHAAASLPANQIRSVAIVDGIAPLEKISGHGGYAQVGFKLARNRPRVARAAFNLSTRQMPRRPNVVMRRTSHFFSKCDRSMFFEARNARILIDAYLECVRCGPEGVIYDMSLLSCPWGFCLKDISVPVRLYYGARDITTPPRTMGCYLNRAIPNSTLTVIPGEGHLSMLNRAGDMMFAQLLSDIR